MADVSDESNKPVNNRRTDEEGDVLNVLSDVCMISVLLYWPTPLELKALTLDL